MVRVCFLTSHANILDHFRHLFPSFVPLLLHIPLRVSSLAIRLDVIATLSATPKRRATNTTSAEVDPDAQWSGEVLEVTTNAPLLERHVYSCTQLPRTARTKKFRVLPTSITRPSRKSASLASLVDRSGVAHALRRVSAVGRARRPDPSGPGPARGEVRRT